MIRILQVSDVHLGAPLSGFGDYAPERQRAVREAFRELPQLADRLEVDAVLVAGDLFDSQMPESGDVDVAREVLRGLADGGRRPVFAIPGNHDACSSSDSPWHAMPAEIEVFLDPSFGAPRSVDLGEDRLHVYGIAFDREADPDPLAGFHRTDAEGIHVVLLHAGMLDNPDWAGGHGLQIPPTALEALDADYVALGDYHRCRLPAEFPGNRACYSGSLAAVRVTETGPHGVVVVELSGGTFPAARLEPSSAPVLVDLESIDMSDIGSDLEAADRIGDRLEAGASESEVSKHPVVSLVGEPGFPLDGDRVQEALTERFGFAAVSDETRFIDSDRVRSLCEEPSVVGHVARLGRASIEGCSDDEERRIAERALRIALRALALEDA